jgi:hypothetical protein
MRQLYVAALTVVLAGCGSLRWSGGGPPPAETPAPARVAQSPHPRPPHPVVAPPTEIQRQTAVFYSDLGPEEVDVSAYPLMQRRNYRVYAAACSRCHSLARSINSPLVSRTWWEFYVMSMRARGSFTGRPLTKEEVTAVLDFLEYDGQERKAKRSHDFEHVTGELKRRFEALLDERMERLQKEPQPAILSAP